MLLKYFYEQTLAHASYLVGCQATGEAIIIDPGRDVEVYLHEAEANDLQIVAAAETHIHADFVSGARELAERTGARLYLSDEGDKAWKYLFADDYEHVLLKDGDRFMVGNVRFDVLHTPGHTPEHVSFMLTDTAGADGPMGIFTGDFVFVGAVGRPDLLEKAAGIKDTAVSAARQMFRSVQRFKELPDYLQVWPAHGAGSACGKGLGAVPSTTVGYEKMFNPALSLADEERFVEELLEGQPEPPKYFAVMKQVNKEGPPLLHTLQKPEHLPAQRIPELLEAGATVVDVRDPEAFAGRHIRGTINIPLPDLANWAGWLVDYERSVYLIINSEEVDRAVHDLLYIGIDDIGGYFEPTAIEVLAEGGRPPESYEVATADRLAERILSGEVTVVDVRSESEWAEEHLADAVHIMLGYLPERSHEVINSKPLVVQCRTGARSAIGASILQAAGAAEVINMQGGLRDWAAAGLPVEH